MPAVSDTSPISNLASIGHLHLLHAQFSAVWIPGAVMQELKSHPQEAAQIAIQDAFRQQWLRTREVSDSPMLRILLAQLHQGEAEAIALAAEMKADFLLLDEQEARRTASNSGLVVTGVLGVLLHAKRMGEIPTVRPLIDLLRRQAGFFIAPGLEARILASAGE